MTLKSSFPYSPWIGVYERVGRFIAILPHMPLFFRAFLGAVSATLVLLVAAPVALAAPVAGELVKVATDRAVYYVGEDGKRYAFPNVATYASWYADFSGVRTISAQDLSALQLGGNVTYRPGTRLVKIATDPKVYAVEPGGALRPIDSEAVASALYGPAWSSRVDDVPVEFFVNYVVGEPLSTATFPSGSVVRRASNNAVFIIDGGLKRRVANLDALSALRIRETFILGTADSLAGYADATDVTASDTTYADTSQTSRRITTSPTFSLIPSANGTFPVPGDATLATLRLISGTTVSLRKLAVQLLAGRDEPLDNGVKGLDDDDSGLVKGLDDQLNITEVRIVDASGATVLGGSQTLIKDYNRDQQQTFVFSGAVNIPAGSGVTLRVVAKTHKDMRLGETYSVTLPRDGISLADARGAEATFLPSGDLAALSLSGVRGTLDVLSSGLSGETTVIKGAKDAAIAAHAFVAPSTSPIVVRRIAYSGFVDEREPGGTVGFARGSDADNGSPTSVNAMVQSVSLYDTKGVRIAGPNSVDLLGKASFDGLQYVIPAGTSVTLTLRGDISPGVDLESVPNGLAFDIADASKDVLVTDEAGAFIEAIGTVIAQGEPPRVSVTLRETGGADMHWYGGGLDDKNVSRNATAGTEVLLGRFDINPKYDDYALQVLTLKDVGVSSASLGELRAEYVTKDGVTASVTGTLQNGRVTFVGMSAFARRNVTGSVNVYGSLRGRAGGAISGEKLALQVEPAGPLQFTSLSTGKVYGASSFGNGSFTLGVNTASGWTVRWTSLLVARSAANVSVGFRSNDTQALRFTVTASPQGGARINKLIFRVTPGDRGFTTKVGLETILADNDSLERWADMNGDFQDDDSIVTLYQVPAPGTLKQPLGEGSDGSIQYRIGSRTTSEGVDSSSSDFGVITYVFPERGGIGIAPGSSPEFVLELDTIAFDNSNDYSLGTDLQDGANFLWSDDYGGGGVSLPGDKEMGLPVSNGMTIRH